jgi:hypothetical protein
MCRQMSHKQFMLMLVVMILQLYIDASCYIHSFTLRLCFLDASFIHMFDKASGALALNKQCVHSYV